MKKPTRSGPPRTARPATTLENALYERVLGIVDAARTHAARSVNTAMVRAYWLIGREIVEVEQRGQQRAGYGERVVEGLAQRLGTQLGKGFSVPNLRNMRQFYLTYPRGSAIPEAHVVALPGHEERTAPGSEIRSALPSESSASFPPYLGWTHYLTLMRVANPSARAFYEIEAARESWSSRELERQIAALLYERLTKSRNKKRVLSLAQDGLHLEVPSDVLKEPFVLEFLELDERAEWQERDLEQAIMDKLEGFLLELGKGFCFVARQKRMTLEGDHFYVDLVFYNRLLRCFVLVDLKLGKLTHQDLGQMQMYVNFFDQFQRSEHEANTIGIILCSEKNDAMVKITLPRNNQQVLAANYQMYLPTEAELRAELARERDAAERALRHAAEHSGGDPKLG